MSPLIRDFWKLRYLGKTADARKVMSSVDPLKADHALMANSFTRLDQGGPEAQRELRDLEQAGTFHEYRNFLLPYAKALNLFAQGRLADALEQLLAGSERAKDPLELFMRDSMQLICLQGLNFGTREAAAQLEKLIQMYESDPDMGEIARHSRIILRAVRLRELFHDGQFRAMLKGLDLKTWSQAHYFCGWMASLPYVRLDSGVVESALGRLTQETDFYLRSYRLQTLVGRSYQISGRIQSSWGDRIDRLYLWTWRWLAEPSPSHSLALAHVLAEVEAWSGLDVLSVEDSQMARNAIEWILIFEPQLRSRLSSLLRRLRSAAASSTLFSYEHLWIDFVRLTLGGQPTFEVEQKIQASPLDAIEDLQIGKFAQDLVKARPGRDDGLVIDPDSGQVYLKGDVAARSQSLAVLMAGLVQSGSMSFADILEGSFGISPYDPEIHDSKIQNLLVRARKLFDGLGKITTRAGWAYLDADRSQMRVGSPKGRARLKLDFSKDKRSQIPARNRNERSLSLLLKEASGLHGKEFSRIDLERALGIPKASLNRYLKVWLERGWIEKNGSGPKVTYRITFFDS